MYPIIKMPGLYELIFFQIYKVKSVMFWQGVKPKNAAIDISNLVVKTLIIWDFTVFLITRKI